MTLKLITAKIENFKSLGDVELSFRDLTVIVGSNSSGKSNSLEALKFTKNLLVSDSLSMEYIQKAIRLGTQNICLTIVVENDGDQAQYSVCVASNKKKNWIASETLIVNGTEVIKIINGKGEVSDEDGKNTQKYKSDPENIESLALRFAGNFGNKPFTEKLATYIREWEFYDIDPSSIRLYEKFNELFNFKSKVPSLDDDASDIQEVLDYWAKNQIDTIEKISKELEICLNIKLDIDGEKDQNIKFLEGDGKKMPLVSMSDGTLRLIAYLTLLYQEDANMPTLIAIEEPERNFHPGILKDIASIMKRLSKKTQVVFTTHSSQLLDSFSPEEISSEISVILLSQKSGLGTTACLLDKLTENHDDISDWMTDFGIGSAIYHSSLIEGILAS
ncbi:AAA family ATPase [Cronbergia sp. UHCC 0137]|uniref:AAA family ATPase n=1 Tax=Cronbergia sp. UHCC 0137 TaxID=3110239 RepID=UPI002B1EE8AD|nr:AAA family ATPase [Cronbergia sp. UHCC 0137]MEA5616997.1 AAA family ATPase [Cronbergia sp. UHCC 0137]